MGQMIFYFIITLIWDAIGAQIAQQTDGKYRNLHDYLLGQLDERIAELEKSLNPLDWLGALLLRFLKAIVSSLLGMIESFVITEEDISGTLERATSRIFDRIEEGQMDIKTLLTDIQDTFASKLDDIDTRITYSVNTLYDNLKDATHDIITSAFDKMKDTLEVKFDELTSLLGEEAQQAGSLASYINAALEGVENATIRELDDIQDKIQEQADEILYGAEAIANAEILASKLLSKDILAKIDELAYPSDEVIDQSIDTTLIYIEKWFKKYLERYKQLMQALKDYMAEQGG